MRYLTLIMVFFLLNSCTLAPSEHTQQLDRILFLRGAFIAQFLSLDAFQKQQNLTKEIAEKGEKIKATANYVAPFDGCSRISSTYYIENSGFVGYERAYNYIFKICELENEQFEVTLMEPQIDGLTGLVDVIDRASIDPAIKSLNLQ